MKLELSIVEQRLVKQFWDRKTQSSVKGYKVDNSRLYAGSPMYYYCRYCGIHTQTLSETHFSTPRTICDGCQRLVDAALMPPPKEEEIT